MTSISWRKAIQVLTIGVLLVAGAGPRVAAAKDPAPPDAPYSNILVIFLGDSFDIRRYFETEVVKALADRGVTAVRSTSMMDSRVPMVRSTFAAMVEEIGADAVLVSHAVSLQTEATMVDMNPQATYNLQPTWYYNVWTADLTEYVAPQGMNLEHDLSLASQLYSVESKEAVWALETESNILVAFDEGPDYSIFVDEAHDLVKKLHRSGLISD